MFELLGPLVAGEGYEWKRRLIGDSCPVGQRGVTTTKTTVDERRRKTTRVVSRAGPGATNPGKTTEGMWWLSIEEMGICGVAG